MRVFTKHVISLAIPMAIVVGSLFCLQSILWDPIVSAGTLQDAQKAGKKAVKDAEKNSKKAVKDTEKAVKEAPKDANKGLKGIVKGTDKAIDQAGDAAKDTRIPGFGKGKKGGGGESDEEAEPSDDSDQGETDTGLNREDGDGEFEDSMDEGGQAGYADEEAGNYEESSSEESRPPVDLNEMKGQIPGFTPFGQEESGSSEGSTVEGGKPWYEKLGKPGGGPPPSSDEDDE